DPQMAMSPPSEKRAESSADVDHRVINRVADGADVLLGSAGRGADHARLHQRHAQSGKNQNAADKQSQRHGVAHGSQPGSADRADQEIRGAKNQVRHRKSAAEAQPVGGSASENREEPHHAAEDASQSPGLLGGEIQLLLQVQSERSEGPVVGKTFENLADVGNPEGLFEAGADLVKTFGKGQALLLSGP